MQVADWIMFVMAFANGLLGAWHASHGHHVKAGSYFHLANFGVLLIILSQVLRR